MKKTLISLIVLLAFTLFLSGCSLLTGKQEPISSVNPGNDIPVEQSTEKEKNSFTEQTEHQAETETSNTAAPKLSPSSLVGSWISIRRDKNTLYTSTLIFNENGTVSSYGCEYYNAHYVPFGNETGWYPAPMGFPGDYGTYTIEGATLKITYTAADYGEYNEPYTDTLVISSIGDEKLVVDDNYGTYITTPQNLDLIELCKVLGVDYSAG